MQKNNEGNLTLKKNRLFKKKLVSCQYNSNIQQRLSRWKRNVYIG